jgi:hypothetical protein
VDTRVNTRPKRLQSDPVLNLIRCPAKVKGGRAFRAPELLPHLSDASSPGRARSSEAEGERCRSPLKAPR